jgi:ribosomal protein L3
MCALILITILTGQLLADEVELGDNIDRVLEVLGKPSGMLRSGTLLIMQYERGTVSLTNGKVTKLSIVSSEEAEQKTAKRLKREADNRAARAAARKKRIQEGTAAKAAKLEDEAFKELPAEEQLEYWKGFQQKYPEVSVSTEIKPLEEAIGKETEETMAMAKEAIAEEIKATEEAIDTLANRSGVGRQGLAEGVLELKRLRAELADLRAKQAELLDTTSERD